MTSVAAETLVAKIVVAIKHVNSAASAFFTRLPFLL